MLYALLAAIPGWPTGPGQSAAQPTVKPNWEEEGK